MTHKEQEALFQKGYKHCPQCKVVKELNDFYNNKNTKHGKATYCKICHKQKKLMSQGRQMLKNELMERRMEALEPYDKGKDTSQPYNKESMKRVYAHHSMEFRDGLLIFGAIYFSFIALGVVGYVIGKLIYG